VKKIRVIVEAVPQRDLSASGFAFPASHFLWRNYSVDDSPEIPAAIWIHKRCFQIGLSTIAAAADLLRYASLIDSPR